MVSQMCSRRCISLPFTTPHCHGRERFRAPQVPHSWTCSTLQTLPITGSPGPTLSIQDSPIHSIFTPNLHSYSGVLFPCSHPPRSPTNHSPPCLSAQPSTNQRPRTRLPKRSPCIQSFTSPSSTRTRCHWPRLCTPVTRWAATGPARTSIGLHTRPLG
jgi:hypothetical protein